MAGHIEKRGKNSWRLIVSGGIGPDGRRIQHKKPFKGTEPQAEKALAAFVTEVEKGQYIPPAKMTFQEFSEKWLKEHAEKNLAPKTVFGYKNLLYSRVFPAIGHIKIEKLQPLHLVEFYNNLSEDGLRADGKPGPLSGKTAHAHHRVISSILGTAVQWQLILSNPASRVTPPKIEKKRAVCYDEDQTTALLTALDGEPLKYKTIITLAVFTGLRRGELMGLEWQDVDFKKGTLQVRQASQYLPGQGTFTKDPKNESSKRIIAVPVPIMALLRQHKKQQAEMQLKFGDLWGNSDRVFTTTDGKPMHPDTATHWFIDFLERHGLPHIPLHGLRHTSATLMINEGIPLTSVSGRLGHSSTSTTSNIYIHYLKSADQEAANRLERLYNERLNKKAESV